jgi:uncharacterized protein
MKKSFEKFSSTKKSPNTPNMREFPKSPNTFSNTFRHMLTAFVLGILLTSAFFIYTSMNKPTVNVVSSAPKQLSLSNEQDAPSTVVVQNVQYTSHAIEKTVPVLAVTQDESQGIAGNLTVKLIPGDSQILIDTSPYTETDLQYSANTAVDVAKAISGNNASDEDIVLTYSAPGQVSVIGGGSAGAAATLATIAALEDRQINPKVAITGTINPDGTIGQVAGILEKAKAAADAGYTLLLVPKGQSNFKYYEKQVNQQSIGFGMNVYNVQYVPKTIDITAQAKQWGLDVKEVSTIQEVEQYMLE